MPSVIFSGWMASQRPRASGTSRASTMDRNLEEALDVRRRKHEMRTLMPSAWTRGLTVDFCSNDSLAFGTSGRLRKEFEGELARNPGVQLGVGGSRLMGGNYDYIETVEREIAGFHGVEAALLVGSGCDGNYVIMEGVPRPGDVIVYDELVHASIMDGMSRSLASARVPFAHNDNDAFREALESVWESQPLVRQSKRSVLIVVESFYSMEGDICPLEGLVRTAKEILPGNSARFIVDEAHSMGVIGKRGSGLVEALGLSSEIAVRTHTFSKAFGSIGGVVLASQIVKDAILNFSRTVTFTAAPAFHQVAAIRAGYTLVTQPQTELGRDKIQHLVKYLFTELTAHPLWDEANQQGILSLPVSEDWEEREFQSQIVSLSMPEHHGLWLSFHLDARNYSAFPVSYPVVPQGSARLRMVIRADHSEEQIEGLVAAICEWAEEMLQIETGVGVKEKVPWAARQVYMLTSEEGVCGDMGRMVIKAV